MSSDDPERASSQRGAEASEDGMSMLDLLVLMARERALVLGLPTVVAAIALVVALVLPHWYQATTKILPPQQTQSSALAMLGQLGGLAGSAGQALGLKNPSDMYVAMLKSRTIADKLIERFDLKAVYKEELLFHARAELARNSNITAARDGIITIEVEDKDRKRASDLANAYVEELRDLTSNLAVTEAGQRRLFFEAQLKKAKDDLTATEIELKKFTQTAGLINPQGQISLSVSAAATLRAQIAAKEIQLSAMRTYATETNPAIKLTLQELTSLQAELAKMEKATSVGKGDVFVPFGKAPEIGLEYVRRYRDMKYFETLYEVLAKQYEVARIDEAKDAAVIQILDLAVLPERKSKPRRAEIVGTAALIAGVLSVLIALARGRLRRALRDPLQAAQLDELRRLIRVRRTG